MDNKTKKEHARLVEKTKNVIEGMELKTSDRIVVIVSNKDGLWALNGNLDPKNAFKMMNNCMKEYNSTSTNTQ